VLEAIAVSLTMTHGRVETLFLEFKLNYRPYESCLEDKNSTPELFTSLRLPCILLAFAIQMLFWIWSAFIRRNALAVVIGIKQPELAVCNSPFECCFISPR
jgi:hypothetical protein